jgi:SMI1-KNR4 cell-wall
MEKIMQKWQRLLNEIRVVSNDNRVVRNNKLYTVSEEEIISFEAQHNIILPKEYRDFCKILGSGSFGSSDPMDRSLTTYCLPPDQSEVADLKQELEKSKDVEGSELGYRLRDGETLDVETTSQILDHAFVFGHTDGGELLIWDLRSYSPSDGSYDIYITRVEDFPGVFKIGRDFFEFIQLFGFGIGEATGIPDWAQPHQDGVEKIFAPYKPRGTAFNV